MTNNYNINAKDSEFEKLIDKDRSILSSNYNKSINEVEQAGLINA
jgi:hypothetical protein